MNIQDRQKTLTVEGLRQRYNLDGLDNDRKSIQLIKNSINKVEIEFGRFMDVINGVLNEYQSQAEITAWFFDGIPTDTQPEFEIQSDHLGDLYYDRQTGKVYQYKYDEDYIWQEITDAKVIESMAIENSKADTSDNKRIVFNETPTTPYTIGDVWINNGTYYRCRAARESGNYSNVDWVKYTDYTEDMVMLDTRAAIDQLQTNVETNYVSQVQLETNTQGIYATVSSTYATQTTVSTLDGEVQSTKTDVRNIDTRLSVEEGKVSTLITDVGNRTGKTSSLTQEVDEIRAEISDIADITKSAERYEAYIPNTEFQDIASSTPINVTIYPISESISYLYPYNYFYPANQDFPEKIGLKPSNSLTPSNSLVPVDGYPAQKIPYLKTRTLRFKNTSTNEIFDYILPEDLLYYDANVYDIFTADYESRTLQVLKKCKYNADGTISQLTPVETHTYNFDDFEEALTLTQGDYEVSILGYNIGYIKVRLMALNAYTAQYATKIELRTSIVQTRDYVDIEASKKVGNNEVIGKINLSPEVATISANKINIQGVLTAINNDTTTTIDGDKITTGTITANHLSSNSVDASKIVAGTITADKIANATITGSKLVNGTITGTQIANSTISNSNIANGTIENAKIKNGTIEGTKIKNGTIEGTKIANGTITATQISNSTITASKIVDATITGAKIKDATITDAKIANISASKINAGTLSANYISGGTIDAENINVTKLNGSNINKGTITGAGINIYNGTGFLKAILGDQNHPFVSALNVASQTASPSQNASISFRNSTSRNSVGEQIGYISYGWNGGAIYRANGNMNVQSGGAYGLDASSYVRINAGSNQEINLNATGGCFINGANSARMYVYRNCVLQPASGYYAYVGSTDDVRNRIATQSLGPSSLNVKKNLVSLENEYNDLYKDIQKIGAYNYDYKYKNVKDNLTKDYGFIIDEIEDTKHLSKYFRNYKVKKWLDGNTLKSKSTDDEDMSMYKELEVKEWDTGSYIKGLFVMIKALQHKIDELEEKINE